MTDNQQPAEDSANTAQKTEQTEYLHIDDELAPGYEVQPKRRYGEKTIKGIIVGRGEHKQVVDLDQVRKLAALNCSYKDIANFFGVKETTLRDNFRSEIERARETTKHRLMEAMLTNAIERMNPTIQIWLSKNLLGFVDQPINSSEDQVLPWLSDEGNIS